MNTFKDRLEAVLEAMKLDKPEFISRLGYTNGEKIYRLFREKDGRCGTPGYEVLRDISKNFENINIAWLLTGKGAMFHPDGWEEPAFPNDREANAVTSFLPGGERRLERQRVPLYDFEARAGLVPVFTNQNAPLDYISIPDLPRCDGAVYVRGDSMYPLLKSGDIVMYRQIQDFSRIIWGEMYLISFNNDGEEYIAVKFIKKVEGHPDKVLLVSHNQHHAPMEITLDSIRALAMVKASIRFNTMG